MRLHVLVEGASDEAFMRLWCSRLLRRHVTRIIRHQGKGRLPTDAAHRPNPRRRELLHQLPATLRAYGKALNPETDRVLVLVDADQDDCRELKQRLENLLAQIEPRPVVAFCIAIEETEAFFLGDRRALRAAYPDADLSPLEGYVQDSVCSTAELLQQIVGDEFEDKPAWAARITPHLSNEPNGRSANRSPSFHYLRRRMLALAGETEPRRARGRQRVLRPR